MKASGLHIFNSSSHKWLTHLITKQPSTPITDHNTVICFQLLIESAIINLIDGNNFINLWFILFEFNGKKHRQSVDEYSYPVLIPFPLCLSTPFERGGGLEVQIPTKKKLHWVILDHCTTWVYLIKCLTDPM